MTIVYVHWRDACHSASPYPLKKIGDLVELHEVGFLIKETKLAITIGTEHEDDATEVRNWLTIPKSGIIKQVRVPFEKAFPIGKNIFTHKS